MNKHIALVLGTIFSLTILFVPFTGAFASSDTSVALPQFVFSLMFSSVSVGSTIDVTNYNAASGTSSSDSSVHLYNTAGSYSQINRQGINVAQNLLCLRYTIDNPSSGFFDDLIIEPYINGSPAHLYGTYTQSDNNNSITYYMFFYIGADTLRVKDSQGQDITPWGIRFTRTHDISYSWSFSSSSTSLYYFNYTLQSQTVDPGEAAELALDIINVLQLSQLSENLGMINTQLDTGNIASMMESMLTYLAQIPDIIQYIDQLETTDANILSAINIFYQYYIDTYRSVQITSNNILPTIYNSSKNVVPSGWNSGKEFYLVFDFLNEFRNSYIGIRNIFWQNTTSDIHVEVFLSNNLNINNIDTYYSNPVTYFISNHFYNNNYHYLDVYFDTPNIPVQSQYSKIILHITSDKDFSFHTDRTYYTYGYRTYQTSFYTQVLNYLKFLAFGNNSVPSNVQSTTDDINQNATAVNDFQSSTQQSLDQDLQDVPVADYQIQATTGTQYMKAYSEALFNASNGFRIWYMLPLILFVIGMLIRWGVKK